MLHNGAYLISGTMRYGFFLNAVFRQILNAHSSKSGTYNIIDADELTLKNHFKFSH